MSQWRTNANNRLMMKSNLDPTPPPSAQVAPPPRRRARSSSTPTPTIGVSVLAQAAGESATFPGAVTVCVKGFEAQEFIEPNAGVPPPKSLPEVPVASGGACRTRVPVPQIVSGASPDEIIIGSCSQVSEDPNLLIDPDTGQSEPLDLKFTFPLTFTNPAVSFADGKDTARVLGLQAVFTVDASVTAVAALTLTGGTVPLRYQKSARYWRTRCEVSWSQSRSQEPDGSEVWANADRPFFRPDICPVGTDRASVTRCRWSLLVAVGRCCCCHRCCQRISERSWACWLGQPGLSSFQVAALLRGGGLGPKLPIDQPLTCSSRPRQRVLAKMHPFLGTSTATRPGRHSLLTVIDTSRRVAATAATVVTAWLLQSGGLRGPAPRTAPPAGVCAGLGTPVRRG